MILDLGLNFHCIRCGKRTKNINQRAIKALWFDAHIPTNLDFLCPKCYETLTGPQFVAPDMKRLQDRANGIPTNATKFVKETNLRIP